MKQLESYRLLGSSKNNNVNRFLLAAIVLYPFLFIWQGGDFSDTGFHALKSDRFFSELQEGRLNATSFLTYFIGGYWWQWFAGYGLISLRVLFCLLVATSALGVIFLLKHEAPRPVVYLSILAAEAYAIRYTHYSLSYDIVSAAFLISTAVFLLLAIDKQSRLIVTIAGALLALATLARLPSAVAILLFLLLPYNGIFRTRMPLQDSFEQSHTKQVLFYVGFFFFGFLSVMLLFFASLAVAGHIEEYFAKIEGLFFPTNVRTSHKPSTLLSLYSRDLVEAFSWGTAGILWIVAAGNIFTPKNELKVKSIFFTFSAIVLLQLVLQDPSYKGALRYLPFSIYFIWSAFFITRLLPAYAITRNAVLAGVIISIASFAGSNTGVLKASYGMLLLIPACTTALWNLPNTHWLGMRMHFKSIAVCLALLLFISSATATLAYVFHVSSGLTSRTHLRFPFELPLLSGIYTTKNRADFINQVVPVIKNEVKGETMYVYGHTPILYFLTQTSPFIPQTWFANRAFSSNTVVENLNKEAERSALPVIVVTDRHALGEKGWALFYDFLTDHNYQPVFERKFGEISCEIWSPGRPHLRYLQGELPSHLRSQASEMPPQ